MSEWALMNVCSSLLMSDLDPYRLAFAGKLHSQTELSSRSIDYLFVDCFLLVVVVLLTIQRKQSMITLVFVAAVKRTIVSIPYELDRGEATRRSMGPETSHGVNMIGFDSNRC